MLMKILIALAVIVVVFVVVVATRPSEYRVARTVTISAPAPAVFAQVNDFHKWDAWNPWAKMDPAMKQTYEGAPAGTGAVYPSREARDAAIETGMKEGASESFDRLDAYLRGRPGSR